MAEVAAAFVSVAPDLRGFGSKLSKGVESSGGPAGAKAGSSFGKVFARSAVGPLRVLGAAAVGIFAADKVKDFFESSIEEARESQKVSALTTQVIKSTGGAANVSAGQVGKLATAISNKVGIDDEAIQSGANLLLTFKNIRNETGKGNDIFNQATQSITDLGAAMGKDPKSGAIQLGKALNDPIKGITALTRVGVSFTDQQQKQIKALVTSGDTLDAQKIILKELQSEFGGAAAASSTAGEKFTVAFDNLKEQIGTALLPYLDDAEQALTGKVIPAVSTFLNQIQSGKGRGGAFAAEAKKVAASVVNLGHDVVHVAEGPLGDDLIGAFKLTVSIGKTVEKVLDAIPGPVKKIGAEGLIAAAVFKQFSSTLSGMRLAYNTASSVQFESGLQRLSQSVGGQVRGLQALRTELVSTQTVLKSTTAGVVPTSFTGLQIPASNAAAAQKYASSLQLVETRSLNTRAALAKLAPAAKQVAGVGGFVALAAGAQQSNDALSTLETTAGAAVTGFAVGGPAGAAIGGFGGLVYSLGTKFGQTRLAAEKTYDELGKANVIKTAESALKGLKGTLDQVTGAYTGATRAAVLQTLSVTPKGGKSTVDIAAQYGISSRALVNAALGQKGAVSALTAVVSNYQSQMSSLDTQINAVKASTSSYVTVSSGGHTAGRVLTEDALEQVNALTKQKLAAQTSLTELQKIPGTLRADAQATQTAAAATAQYAGKLKGIPKAARTQIEADGIVPTVKGVANVAAHYKLLDKKQIKTLISASGADTTVRQVQKVIDKTKAAGNVKVNFSSILKSLNLSLDGGARAATEGGAKINAGLKSSTGKAKANLDPFRASVKQGAQSAVGPASSGGQSVGSALGNGVVSGFGPTQSRLVTAAVAAVRAAIAAARKAADAHSPSRKMALLGKDMGDGLALGLEKSAGTVGVAAATLAAGLFGALAGQSPTDAAAQTISDYIGGLFTNLADPATKTIDGQFDELDASIAKKYKAAQDRIAKLPKKQREAATNKLDRKHDADTAAADKARTKAQAQATKNLTNAQNLALRQSAALRASLAQNTVDQNNLAALIGSPQTVASAYDQLQSAIDTRDSYGKSLVDRITGSFDVSGSTSFKSIINGLTKANAAAGQYQQTLASLQAAGLNQSSFDQLVQAGPAALKSAQALLSQGQGGINEVNQLEAQLEASAQATGTKAASYLYQSGVDSAQNYLSGLQSQQAALAAAASSIGAQIAAGLATSATAAGTIGTNVAKTFTAKTKKHLKIKSPSRVFADIGTNVVKGLALGLDDSGVDNSAAAMAARLRQGFGSPSLSARGVSASVGGVSRGGDTFNIYEAYSARQTAYETSRRQAYAGRT